MTWTLFPTTQVQEYVGPFVTQMDGLSPRGMDFESTVKETLWDALGESPSQALVRMIGTAGLRDPHAFALQVSRCLGNGASLLFLAVAERAKESPSEEEM